MNPTFARRAASLLAVSVLTVALIAVFAPLGYSETSSKEVTVTNTPLPVTQSGPWTVGISGTPTVRAEQTGEWEVGISGTPTVQQGLPATSFSRLVSLNTNTGQLMGTSTGKLAVTSITFTNFANTPHQVQVRKPVLADGTTSCSGAQVIGGSEPRIEFLIPARETLHVEFPTPIGFTPSDGQPSCLEAIVRTTISDASVDVFVNGFVQ